jgi:hypothetical protein
VPLHIQGHNSIRQPANSWGVSPSNPSRCCAPCPTCCLQPATCCFYTTTCRAVDLADQFHELQQRAATAAPPQQVGCVDTFTALSSSLQQLVAKQQQRQQQQHQPEQRCTPSRAPPAAEAQAASPLWCSVTTNALFDSTPASGNAAVPSWTPAVGQTTAGSSRLSPVKPEGDAAAAAAAGSSTEDYWGLGVDFQPLRASLSAVRASQQLRLAPVQAPHSQQQSAASQLLRQLQEEMQQWFVAYVEEHLCKAQLPVNTRGDCVELLKALTHAQQWIQQQQGADAASRENPGQRLSAATCSAAPSPSRLRPGSAGMGRNASSTGISCATGGACGLAVAALASDNVAAPAGSTTPPPAAAAGSLSPAALKPGKPPGSQLQQPQVSLRKSLCHLGFLLFQLPA